MKRAIICALLCLFLSLSPAMSQTRSRRAQSRRARPAASAAKPAANVAAGVSRVADQIKTLSRFLYVFGRVSNGIETSDELLRQGNASAQDQARTRQTKESVRASLKNVREGLDDLELYFRTTPGLERYYPRLAGVAQMAATAEDLAAANRFEQAGRSLVDAVNKLTDVLAQMR